MRLSHKPLWESVKDTMDITETAHTVIVTATVTDTDMEDIVCMGNIMATTAILPLSTSLVLATVTVITIAIQLMNQPTEWALLETKLLAYMQKSCI